MAASQLSILKSRARRVNLLGRVQVGQTVSILSHFDTERSVAAAAREDGNAIKNKEVSQDSQRGMGLALTILIVVVRASAA